MTRTTACPLPYRRRPCGNCPFRTDAPPGEFSAGRFRLLRASAGRPGSEAPIGAPVFACHKSSDGHDQACAGWLVTCGHDHLGIRLAVIERRLPATALIPGADWPSLYRDYEAMAAANGAG